MMRYVCGGGVECGEFKQGNEILCCWLVVWVNEIRRGDHLAVLRGQAAPEPSGCSPERLAFSIACGRSSG